MCSTNLGKAAGGELISFVRIFHFGDDGAEADMLGLINKSGVRRLITEVGELLEGARLGSSVGARKVLECCSVSLMKLG